MTRADKIADTARNECRSVRLGRFHCLTLLLAIVFSASSSCRPSAGKFPWPGTAASVPAEHAQVRTLNRDYRRTESELLLREIDVPTRAALDYAAYHANFMIADAAPEAAASSEDEGPVDVSKPFAGAVEKSTLTADIRATPLSDAERKRPLAFAPLVEFLQAEGTDGAAELEEVGSIVREEAWGLRGRPGIATQSVSEVFVHAANGSRELWAKLEFQPWFTGLGSLPDQDADGVPEVYGRIEPKRVRPAVVAAMDSDYRSRVLSDAEVKTWANRLASYWYPSFNTDLMTPGAVWPDEHTEPEVKQKLGSRVYANPTIILRGKPQGKPTYALFFVKRGAPSSADTVPAKPSSLLKLPKTRPTPDVAAVREGIQRELEDQNGSFEAWTKKVAPARDVLRARLRKTPPKVKALAGTDGFLFFRNSLEAAVGGDLEKQKKGKNPLPVIVEFQKALAARGVDFLFVPVPSKVEIFPDRLDPKLQEFAGDILNPYSRKFLLALAEAGVEVVDLLPAFLKTRSSKREEPIFQRQDTHWTDRGLRLAADLIVARIRKYPWFKELSRHAQPFTTREVKFQRLGDLHSRLPDSKKTAYQPEALRAMQVLGPDGAPYEDDPDSPLVVLGDSFTGVYQLTDAEHAGISAHIAKNVGYPLDLVMSYGGGPNVRNKLMRRGTDALETKKLVIWIMTARDLHDYWENWEPLEAK